ncbi:type II toxin-antitoxin system PemK/MazF family toxin [Neorhizobium sp. BETTINA12A]|uniref:type II toxin-antitoxin system PemK/MazF family toxin n=1 Tax=unclassified Neorhizobium TaxID=2629175 RepID=UPI001FF2B1C7|nr:MULTISPECIES: type II toxin-antitoxin system PemK/MazF family toxin [unclassified Neorhizobium]MCJ9745916.1 type II toxin-antitoxin system PemK/MazF family toxin [Neorhizobium sp. SHOUNA12A]MCJ9753226.1 type II toxin-antitoxin system PemK/MazF family toxin [Neorhizobium sp. BETTINA12A]
MIAVFPGELGKPRPAVILQADEFLVTYTTALACPLTTHLLEAPLLRPIIEPSAQNGLQYPSQVMVEKITPVRKEVIGQRIGRLADSDMRQIEVALVHVTGLTHTIAPVREPTRKGEQQ